MLLPQHYGSFTNIMQNIPFPFHLLWRLDTLLLNLGLTLILSAFYFNPTPIYRHFHPSRISDGAVVEAESIPATKPDRDASKYLWLAWVIIVLVHVGVNLAWKVVGRLGVGAVTWGVSLLFSLLHLILHADVFQRH